MEKHQSHLERLFAQRLDRRRLLVVSSRLAGLAALGLFPGTDVAAAPKLGANPFTLGVASGDPLPDSVVLWTRLAPDPLHGGRMPPLPVPVWWQVANDPDMRHIVQHGIARAVPELAHSVHVDVHGLEPAHEYFYRFYVPHEFSPIGRTKTTPAPDARVDELRFAIAACQRWDQGYYAAYRHLAEETLDFVVHLGDYIYEYGIDATGGVRQVPVPEAFRTETLTLERYRLQFALYKSDPDLQAAHARCPWLVAWDDHEVENDYTDAISENRDSSELFLLRRAAAYQAYYEHLPLRHSSLPQGPDMRLYRRMTYGDLAEFNVLDTRQYRSDQPCGDGETPRCAAALDPATTMLGPAQEQWLLDGLDQSRARWNVLAQQVLMAELDHQIGPGEVFWNDAWDGYPAARERILRHLASRPISNPIVLSGDWHSTFVNDLKLDFKDPTSPTVATEFACTSISSNGDQIVYGPYYGPMIPENPHIKFIDGDRRGYMRCHLTQERWQTDLRYVETVSRPDAPVYTEASFVVEHGAPGAYLVGHEHAAP
jgi:alkaline phosphatase D